MRKKNVLILSSSHCIGGNTDLLCDQFELGAKDSGHTTDKINLMKKEIKSCIGCGVCQNNGGVCAIKDDMNIIIDKMMDADIIVMATPVYYSSMNGKMKNLIDRTFPKFREMKDKEFYFISTAASSDDEIMEDVIDVFRKFIYFLPNSVEKGTILDGYAGAHGAIKGHKVYNEAYQMGKNI